MRTKNTWLALGVCIIAITGCVFDGKPSNTTNGQDTALQNTPAGALNLITYRYLPKDKELFDAYAQQANKEVNVILKSSDEIVEMAKSNQLVGGDVVIVDNLYDMHQLIEMGVMDPFHVDIFGAQIPSKFVDSEGYWSALSRWSMSFVFREDKVDMMQMKNYAGVLNPAYKGKVVMSHPDSSGLVTMIAYMIGAHGEEAAEFYLKSLANNLVEMPQGNDYQQVQKVMDGQADIALVSGSAYLRYKHSGNPDIYKGTEGLMVETPLDAKKSNYYDISAVGIVKDAANRKYAMPMVEFLSVTEAQETFNHAMMEYSVNVYAEEMDFLMNIDGLPQGEYSPETAENQLDRARELIREIIKL